MANEPREIETGGELVAFIGEDIGRKLMARVAALLAVVCIVAGAMSESASPNLKTALFAVGGAGVLLILIAGLFNWRQSRQWLSVAVVVLSCVGLLAAVYLGSR